MPVIYFTVTTDLTYDQRMIRICRSLSAAGYQVILVGRKMRNSQPISVMPYRQVRLSCFFEKGILFYIDYQIRLFFFLLFKKMDGICAIDLDSILPCLWISKIKGIPRIYDAHELFCEMKEIVSRPKVYRVWKWIEKRSVPHFEHGYTVNQPIADEFKKLYQKQYAVIRNMAVYDEKAGTYAKEKFILYQGAVNEGRSFETLIPAMQWVDARLVICGEGNFFHQAKALAQQYHVQHKVIFTGMLLPDALKDYTHTAYIGITLFEKEARSNYYSLANRFFDYIHSATPQLCVDYPVYREINNLYPVAVLIRDLSPPHIAQSLNLLLQDEAMWTKMQAACYEAAKVLNWQEEEKKLIAFYKNIFG